MADTVSEEVRINGITEGVIWKELLKFSAPLLVGNLFQQLYNTVDSIVVGKFVGSDALAAVGSSMVIINMLIGLFMGIAAGAGVLVSQYYGAKREEMVSYAVHTAIAFSLAAGVVMTVVGNRELPRLSAWVSEIDPKAFLIVGRANEVRGRGFTMGKVYR